jgi:hypothetical protein
LRYSARRASSCGEQGRWQKRGRNKQSNGDDVNL